MSKLPPIHPGEVLLEDYIKPRGLTGNRVAMDLRVPANRLNDIVRGKRAITADTALRLAKYFGTSAAFWLGMQTQYDLEVAEDALGEQIDREVIVLAS